MRRLLGILVCVLGMYVYAIGQELMTLPTTTMQSVNNPSYMSSGSAYSSTIQPVGSSAPAASPIFKAPPSTGGESGYDPDNPQFGPIGDALIPLSLMALIYALVMYFRRRKEERKKTL